MTSALFIPVFFRDAGMLRVAKPESKPGFGPFGYVSFMGPPEWQVFHLVSLFYQKTYRLSKKANFLPYRPFGSCSTSRSGLHIQTHPSDAWQSHS